MFERLPRPETPARRKPAHRLPELALIPDRPAPAAFIRTLQLAIKRGLDILFSMAALAALSVLMLGLAAAIRRAAGQPALMRVATTGKDGAVFDRLVFRTQGQGRLSSVLTASGLEGLPQLVNVLRGEMALIGPLPRPPGNAAKSPAMRPGLVGFAHLEGHRHGEAPGMPRRAAERSDLAYAANFSLLLDARIALSALLARR